jgi:hypothetical protein
MIKSSYMYILDACEKVLALIFFGNTKIYHKYTNKMKYPFPQLFFYCLILWSIYVVGPFLWISIRVHCLRVPDCHRSPLEPLIWAQSASIMRGRWWDICALLFCYSTAIPLQKSHPCECTTYNAVFQIIAGLLWHAVSWPLVDLV